jgi:hypothetical protein
MEVSASVKSLALQSWEIAGMGVARSRLNADKSGARGEPVHGAAKEIERKKHGKVLAVSSVVRFIANVEFDDLPSF